MGDHAVSFWKNTAPLVWSTSSSRVVSMGSTRGGAVETDRRNRVVAQLAAERVLHGAAAPAGLAAVRHLGAAHEPVIGLMKLVAVLGVVEEEREVGVEVEVVAEPVRRHPRGGVAAVRVQSNEPL